MQAIDQQVQTPATGDYSLSNVTGERQRIDAQAALLRPATERLLREAGVGPGMRVLDVGSGTGEATLLAASLVGPAGSVVAVDRSPAMLTTVRHRAFAYGYPQIKTIESDINALSLEDRFDAVIGRLVLMHQPDPVGTLRYLSRFVRPDGVMAFLEFHFFPPASWPRRPLHEQATIWAVESLRLAGVHMDLGLKLYSVFREAGLPCPTFRLEPLIGTGEDPALCQLLAETTRTCLPLIERFGLATREEVDIETLDSRLRAEARAIGGVAVGPVQGCAWARLPL